MLFLFVKTLVSNRLEKVPFPLEANRVFWRYRFLYCFKSSPILWLTTFEGMFLTSSTWFLQLTATLPRSQHKRSTLPRDMPADITINIDPAPDEEHEFTDSETSTNCGSLERLDNNIASRSPSIRSGDVSRAPSSHGSHKTVNSAQSTPKGRHTPRLGWRYVTALDFRKRQPVNRTVSDIPKSSCPALRKSKSTTSLTDQDHRLSGGELSLCTSSESFGSDSGVVLRNQLGLPESNRPIGKLQFCNHDSNCEKTP